MLKRVRCGAAGLALLALIAGAAARAADTPAAGAHADQTPLAADAPTPAALVVLNANIYTASDAHPRARALAVGGGVVRAVGEEAEVRPLIGPHTRVVDMGG